MRYTGQPDIMPQNTLVRWPTATPTLLHWVGDPNPESDQSEQCGIRTTNNSKRIQLGENKGRRASL